MAGKIYKKIGIRKDKNLVDLSNSVDGLNNLLAPLVDDAQSTFISDDLNAIRGVYSLGLKNGDYRQIIGSALEVTTPTGATQPFRPRITYQNKLDTYKVFAGEPRIFGGNGLTARYFAKTSVFENTVGIFAGAPFKTDNYWEQGIFNYTGKITPEAVDVNGGVEWEGFFIPTATGSHYFYIDTSAGFTFDFQTQGYISGIGTYTEIARVGLTTTLAGSGTINNNYVTLSTPANAKYVGIGLSVAASGIATGSIVSGYNTTTGVISLTPPTGSGSAVYNTFSGNITFFKNVGQNTRVNYSTYNLTAYQRYRIRIRYFIPQAVDATLAQRYFQIRYSYANSGVTFLRYNYLYPLNYDFSDGVKGNLSRFLDTSLNSGGGTIGGTTNSNSYVAIKSAKKIDITYQPKTSISSVIKSTPSASITSGTNIMSISDTSNIEVGNYIFGTGITDGTRVAEIAINAFIVLSQNATATNSGTYTFVEHRGFVKRATGSSSTNVFTLSSGTTNLLKSGMVMIGSGVQAYTGITTSTSTSTILISPSQSIAAGTDVYFYQSRGLINNGLAAFCVPTQTQCLIVTADTPAGSTVIPVSDATGVANGWTVQGFQFTTGTTINGAPTSPTSITISTPTVRNLIAGANFTVTSSTDDRTLCCPPTDTSPPFNPTLQGLETVSDAPNLKIQSGNLSFDALKAVVSAGNITTYSSTDTSGSRLSLQTPSGTFKILCV